VTTVSKTILAVDPGKNDAGVAFFVAGRLVEIALIQPPEGTPYEVARYVSMWARRCMFNHANDEGRVGLVLVEGQQIYRRSKGDPNDLLPLAQCIGGVLARVDSFDRQIVLPAKWTGGVPKPVRQRRLLARLHPEELAMIKAIKPATKAHNVIDAVHIGMWHIGRVETPTDGMVQ
jgi:hypothetical protein